MVSTKATNTLSFSKVSFFEKEKFLYCIAIQVVSKRIVLVSIYGPLIRMSIRDFNNHAQETFKGEIKIIRPEGSFWPIAIIKIDDLKNNQASLLPGGTLTICLEVIKPGPQNAVSCLSGDLENSMEDSQFSDCLIETSNLTIKCHKFMLASRSSVFKAGSFSIVTSSLSYYIK